MRLGKVVGTVVATQKTETLVGSKLLIVQEVDPTDMQPKATFTVAVDTVGVGARTGELVLTVAGSSARLTDMTGNMPVDTAIIAVVDSVEIYGAQVYPA